MSVSSANEPALPDSKWPTYEKKWSTLGSSIYASRQPPKPLGTVSFEEIEEKAKEALKDYPGAFMYAGGSAGTASTDRANRKAFEKYRIVPRMLVDTTVRNLEVTLFGVTHPTPILVAPIGVQGMFIEEADLASARAAQALKVPYIMSTAATRSIEEVAEANGDGHRWYQLYWPKSNDVTLSVLKRAKANGFSALVVTLDTMTIGWRPHDLNLAYIPFIHGVGTEVGRSDPVFMAKHGRQAQLDHHPAFPYDAAKVDAKYVEGDEQTKEDAYLGFKILERELGGSKGIQHVKDAEKCLEYGVDGIVVSNHGGRQVDGAIPSLYALEKITKSPLIKSAQESGKLTILFDSGIRTGSDIIKAIALGAQAVLLGRPWLYGGIVAGQEGIEQVICHTLADLDTTLGLAGIKSLKELRGTAEDCLEKIDFEV